VPRVKKRTEFRQTKTRPISLELGQLLEQLNSGHQPDRLFHWLNELYPEQHIHMQMNNFVEKAHLVSPRTSQALRLSPRRFRYTLGTEAAKEGASPAKIAELLDHSDLQNVDVYVEASSYVVDQLGKKFDDAFEPIARRFCGHIVDSRTKPAFPGVPPKIIPSTSLHLPMLPMDFGGIGLCGRDVRNNGLCRLAPPLTCYPCEFFAAFRDGPHAEVLKALETVRDDLKESSDLRIPMQLDEVVEAVKHLVVRIETEKKEMLMNVSPSEAKYIADAREIFRARFPNGDFDDCSWDIRHLRASQHKKTNARVYFTKYGSTTDPLPPRFARVVKACILLMNASVGTMPLRVDAARMLWQAIEARRRHSHDAFRGRTSPRRTCSKPSNRC
jgi:hypothetical protein